MRHFLHSVGGNLDGQCVSMAGNAKGAKEQPRESLSVAPAPCPPCSLAQGQPPLPVSWAPPGGDYDDVGIQHRGEGTARQPVLTCSGQCFLKRLFNIYRKGVVHICWLQTPRPWGSRSLRGLWAGALGQVPAVPPAGCVTLAMSQPSCKPRYLHLQSKGADLGDPTGLTSGGDCAKRQVDKGE